MTDILSRAQGCLLGQFGGDALGNPVEFEKPSAIKRKFPNGVREMIASPVWGTIPGQLTDDSEMALAMARTILKLRTYNAQEVRAAYVFWYNSKPFDCGGTCEAGIRGNLNYTSQANGALMRVSPLGIFGANYGLEQVARWARQDALLTHPHPVCQQANMLFAMAISYAIQNGCSPDELFEKIVAWANQLNVEPSLANAINASDEPPVDFINQRGWVLIAFQNALYQLLHAQNFEEGLVDTIGRGGDTDTNAAIAGALLGAVYGRDNFPKRWEECLLNCRPEAGAPGVDEPRPKYFWPVDVLEIATALVSQ